MIRRLIQALGASRRQTSRGINLLRKQPIDPRTLPGFEWGKLSVGSGGISELEMFSHLPGFRAGQRAGYSAFERRLNQSINSIEGLKLNPKLTGHKNDGGFGSGWHGIVKLAPQEILDAVAKKFGKIWKQTPEQFVSSVRGGAMDYRTFSESQVRGVLGQITELQRTQRGGIKPGFQQLTLPARGGLPEKLALAYNTALGETVAVGTMYRAPSGEMVRGSIVAAQQFRGKGLAGEISRRMFEAGAIETQAVSTAGAKAYHRVLRGLAEDIARATTQTESQFTTPGVVQRMAKNRGSRRMSGGNN